MPVTVPTQPDRLGLSSREAQSRLKIHGPNRIAEATSVSWLQIFFRQFTSLLIVILIIAAGIAAGMGEIVDAGAILLVVLLNGILGFVQEWRTENALAALRNMLTTEARVMRDGRQTLIDTREIVPGDLVILESGDRVPADLQLHAATALRVDESVLTGESVSVDKTSGGEGTSGRLFMGSSVVFGRGEGLVTATGATTEFGQIAQLTAEIDDGQTNLQVKLGRLATLLGGLALGLAAVIVLVGVGVGRPLDEMFLTAIALAVAMVPEGLPAVVTITLALGAGAMLRRQALVRRLQAVETLGSATVICTDKTGTLTENAMTVTEIWTPRDRYRVTGTGYDPAGHIDAGGARVRHEDDPKLARLLDVAIGCNHAGLNRGPDGWDMAGDPTEGALLTLAYKGWTPVPDPADHVSEVPFDSDRKRMSVVVRRAGRLTQLLKGAPEAVLDVSSRVADATGHPVPMTAADRDAITRATAELAGQGRRVLALARRDLDADTDREEDLVFLGLLGLVDPPRPEVAAAISLCRDAGIRVVMITGDAPETAAAIGREVGLRMARMMTGAELDRATDAEVDAALAGGVHFARSAPAHKMRLVERLQSHDQLVAMTGDGVNDAPALRQADIGIAMGRRGTDVAKEASDLILLDDNFATIVGAVKEGRRQFANIQRFVRYLLASNAGEIVAIVVNLILGGPLIFLATQILWMNLITDGVTAVALGMEKATPDQMRRPPLKKNGPILDAPGFALILAFGVYTGLASLWIFYSHLPDGTDVARTMAFSAMVVFEKVSVFAFRSFRLPQSRIGVLSNPALVLAFLAMMGLQIAAIYWPPLQALLHTVALPVESLGLIALTALPLLVVPEAIKILRASTGR